MFPAVHVPSTQTQRKTHDQNLLGIMLATTNKAICSCPRPLLTIAPPLQSRQFISDTCAMGTAQFLWKNKNRTQPTPGLPARQNSSSTGLPSGYLGSGDRRITKLEYRTSSKVVWAT